MDNIPLGAQIKTSINGETRFDFVYELVLFLQMMTFISWGSKTTL